MTSDEHSRLLDLPAELRVRIYEHIFEDYRVTLPRRSSGQKIQAPSPLMVSKGVYGEAVGSYYASVTFVHTAAPARHGPDALDSVLRSRWPDVKHITVYELSFPKGEAERPSVRAKYQQELESVGAVQGVISIVGVYITTSSVPRDGKH